MTDRGNEDKPAWNVNQTCGGKLLLLFYQFTIALPVLVLFGIYYTAYVTWIALYIYPLVMTESNRPTTYYWNTEEEHQRRAVGGWIKLVLLTYCILMLTIASFRAIFTSPGYIPDEKRWNIVNQSGDIAENEDAALIISYEKNKYGQPRTCERCMKRKPDRTHHCRLCDSCIRRMDHHCPWIANCVGYYNYKYFFLMVFYGSSSCIIVTTTFWETVYVYAHDADMSPYFCFYVIVLYSLITLLGIVVTCFLIFHIYLMMNNMSTIEYCEKKRQGQSAYEGKSPWDAGWSENVREVLGEQKWLWLLPTAAQHQSQGLYFKFNEKEFGN